jgi:hypothetical protein
MLFGKPYHWTLRDGVLVLRPGKEPIEVVVEELVAPPPYR